MEKYGIYTIVLEARVYINYSHMEAINEIRNETSKRARASTTETTALYILFPFPRCSPRNSARGTRVSGAATSGPACNARKRPYLQHIQYIPGEVGNDSWNVVVHVLRVSTLSQKRCVNRMRLIWLRRFEDAASLEAKEKETTGATTVITRRRGKEARRVWMNPEGNERIIYAAGDPINPSPFSSSSRRNLETETVHEWIFVQINRVDCKNFGQSKEQRG